MYLHGKVLQALQNYHSSAQLPISELTASKEFLPTLLLYLNLEANV